MNPKRFVSPVIILVTVTLLGLYFVYTVNSFRVLAKAEESLAKEHGRTASFAYQIVMSKYAHPSLLGLVAPQPSMPSV